MTGCVWCLPLVDEGCAGWKNRYGLPVVCEITHGWFFCVLGNFCHIKRSAGMRAAFAAKRLLDKTGELSDSVERNVIMYWNCNDTGSFAEDSGGTK